MNPLLHWGNLDIIRGFHFLDPLRGSGESMHKLCLDIERKFIDGQRRMPAVFRTTQNMTL